MSRPRLPYIHVHNNINDVNNTNRIPVRLAPVYMHNNINNKVFCPKKNLLCIEGQGTATSAAERRRKTLSQALIHIMLVYACDDLRDESHETPARKGVSDSYSSRLVRKHELRDGAGLATRAHTKGAVQQHVLSTYVLATSLIQ